MVIDNILKGIGALIEDEEGGLASFLDTISIENQKLHDFLIESTQREYTRFKIKMLLIDDKQAPLKLDEFLLSFSPKNEIITLISDKIFSYYQKICPEMKNQKELKSKEKEKEQISKKVEDFFTTHLYETFFDRELAISTCNKHFGMLSLPEGLKELILSSLEEFDQKQTLLKKLDEILDGNSKKFDIQTIIEDEYPPINGISINGISDRFRSRLTDVDYKNLLIELCEWKPIILDDKSKNIQPKARNKDEGSKPKEKNEVDKQQEVIKKLYRNLISFFKNDFIKIVINQELNHRNGENINPLLRAKNPHTHFYYQYIVAACFLHRLSNDLTLTPTQVSYMFRLPQYAAPKRMDNNMTQMIKDTDLSKMVLYLPQMRSSNRNKLLLPNIALFYNLLDIIKVSETIRTIIQKNPDIAVEDNLSNKKDEELSRYFKYIFEVYDLFLEKQMKFSNQNLINHNLTDFLGCEKTKENTFLFYIKCNSKTPSVNCSFTGDYISCNNLNHLKIPSDINGNEKACADCEYRLKCESIIKSPTSENMEYLDYQDFPCYHFKNWVILIDYFFRNFILPSLEMDDEYKSIIANRKTHKYRIFQISPTVYNSVVCCVLKYTIYVNYEKE